MPGSRCHVHDWPVGDAFAVGQTAAVGNRGVGNRREELGSETRLADSGCTQDREQLAGAPRGGAVPGACEQSQLPLPTDHRPVCRLGVSPVTVTSRYATSGCAFPLTSSGSTACVSTAPLTVSWPIRISLG